MASLNCVHLIGNMGQDPELRHTPNGVAVCNFNLATNKRYTDKDGQRHEQTEWHRIVVWQKSAENVAKYCSKGSKVYIQGELQTREWEDNDGNKRFTTEIVARVVQFMDAKGEGGGGSQSRNEPPGPSDDDLPF